MRRTESSNRPARTNLTNSSSNVFPNKKKNKFSSAARVLAKYNPISRALTKGRQGMEWWGKGNGIQHLDSPIIPAVGGGIYGIVEGSAHMVRSSVKGVANIAGRQTPMTTKIAKALKKTGILNKEDITNQKEMISQIKSGSLSKENHDRLIDELEKYDEKQRSNFDNLAREMGENGTRELEAVTLIAEELQRILKT